MRLLNISSWNDEKMVISKNANKVSGHQRCRKSTPTIPFILIKVFMYQLFRSLAYIHSFGMCHGNVKLETLLVDPESGVLNLCDFGSVKLKYLTERKSNTSYMYSKNYLAPELILGSEVYTTKIDMWSAGCVLAELLLGQPLFSGETGVEYLIEIVKICGTPTLEEIREMNPKSSMDSMHWPQIKPHPWQNVFHTPSGKEAIDLVSRLFVYAPSSRISPLEACAHPFFNELRDPNTRLPNGKILPPLFNFTEYELSIQPSMNNLLLPRHMTEGTNIVESYTEPNAEINIAENCFVMIMDDMKSQ